MKVLIATLVLTAVATATAPKSDALDASSLPRAVVDTDYHQDGVFSEAQVELGRLLFFDKILSGNQNISCATCHHPEHASADGLALPLGEGARSLGPERRAGQTLDEGVFERVPRNSPALFNLGAREYTRMFHDGRVETDPEGYYEGGFITPAKWKLPTGLANVLAAQAMFPPTSPAEMAGQQGENDVADARARNNASGPGGVWELLANRLAAIPEYVELFQAAFPDDVRVPDDITFVLAANALAAFQAAAFRADDSPFDRLLRDQAALSEDAQRGMQLFYGEADCSSCHSGAFQTDHDFHAIAMPQVGPGKSDGSDSGYWSATGIKAFSEDFGRGRVTVRAEDRFRFRTPSLRNVTLTGPWGHDGAYTSLEDVVRHHLSPVTSLDAYEVPEDLLVPLDGVLEFSARGSRLERDWAAPKRLEGILRRDSWVQSTDALRGSIAEANELEPSQLSDAQVSDLLAFLESLTDPGSRDLSALIPDSVPSGLSLED